MIINKLKKSLWYIIINKLSVSPFVTYKIRWKLYKLFNANIEGKIFSHVVFEYKNVRIGKGTFVNKYCWFDGNSFINIGENCAIANHVRFCTSTHKIGCLEKRAGKFIEKEINIGNGCWIGANVTILPGVVIEDGCIIAAGAVVTKNCYKNGMYAGVPAKRIKDLK